jgi:hypothetical protein
MRIGKLKIGIFMAALAFGFFIFIPKSTLALEITVESISAFNSANVTIKDFYSGSLRTEYGLNTTELGYLDAFCVENAWAPTSSEKYELISVPQSLYEAAWVAQQYWGGNTWRYNKEDYQIAIWEIVFDSNPDTNKYYYGSDWDTTGNFKYNSGANFNNIDNILKVTFGNLSNAVAVSLAHNPVGDYTSPGKQDYLVNYSVPEPATMILLGFGIFGLGVLRKKSQLA